ncbi:MAG: hypothetical protein ACQESR_15155 [Planctomycetota bacterium]
MTCRQNCRAATLVMAVNLTLTTMLPGQTSLPTCPTASAANPVDQSLVSRVTIDVKEEMTLKQLAQFLRQRFQLNVTIDHGALEEVGLDGDEPVLGLQAHGVTLEEALMIVLDPLDLTLLVRDVMLVITTPERAEEHFTTHVYPVGDLLAWRQFGPGSGQFADYDSLMNVISANVAPDTWDEVGGAGAMEPHANSQSLVITQSRGVHRKVRGLLETLRAAKGIQLGSPVQSLSGNQVGSVPHRAPTAPGGRDRLSGARRSGGVF